MTERLAVVALSQWLSRGRLATDAMVRAWVGKEGPVTAPGHPADVLPGLWKELLGPPLVDRFAVRW